MSVSLNPALLPASHYDQCRAPVCNDASTEPSKAKGCDTQCNDQSSSVAPSAAAENVSAAEATLYSALNGLRQRLSAVTDLGQWLDRVGSALAPINSAPSNADATGDVQASTFDAQGVSRQRGSILIRTQEGDTIRIKFATRTEYAAHSAQLNGDGVASKQDVALSQQSRLRIEVDGNLSDGEQHAIDDVLQKIQSLAEDFFAGDVNAAFSQAQNLNIDSSQLAGVAVRLSQSERLAVQTQQVVRTPVTATPAVIAAVPAPSAPVALPPASTAPNDTSAAKPEPIAVNDAAAVPATPASAPASEPEASVTPATTQPVVTDTADSATQAIARYVAKLTVQLRGDQHAEKWGLSFSAKLEILIAGIRVQQPAVPEPTLSKLSDVAQQINSSPNAPQ